MLQSLVTDPTLTQILAEHAARGQQIDALLGQLAKKDEQIATLERKLAEADARLASFGPKPLDEAG